MSDNDKSIRYPIITGLVLIVILAIISAVFSINSKNEREEALLEDSIRENELAHLKTDVHLLSIKIPIQDIDSNKI